MEKNQKIIAKAIAVALVLVVVYIFMPYITAIVENPPGETYVLLPKKLKFEFERVAVVNVESTGAKYTINFTIPTNSTYQDVVVHDLTQHAHKTIYHDYNRTWWSYSQTWSSKIIIKYSGVTYTKVWNITNAQDVSAIPESLKEQYNHKEYLIDVNETTHAVKKFAVINPDDSNIKNTTEKITQGKKTVLDKLRVIYDFIVHNFQYVTERSGQPKTAAEVWDSRRGDCDELSFVFASMARSIGIPAWVEYGLLYTNHLWGEHAWIQTVVPYPGGLAKVNIDVTAEVGRKDLGRGFLVRDPYRITEWVDDGNSKHLSAYYQLMVYTGKVDTQPIAVKVISITPEGEERLYVGSKMPSWLMLLIFMVIIAAVIAIIVRM